MHNGSNRGLCRQRIIGIRHIGLPLGHEFFKPRAFGPVVGDSARAGQLVSFQAGYCQQLKKRILPFRFLQQLPLLVDISVNNSRRFSQQRVNIVGILHK